MRGRKKCHTGKGKMDGGTLGARIKEDHPKGKNHRPSLARVIRGKVLEEGTSS